MADTTQAAPRSQAEIQNDIAAARARLAKNITTLISQAHPKTIAQRQLMQAKSFVETEFEHAKSQVKDDSGWRVDRLAGLLAALAGFATLIAIIRTIVKKAKNHK